MIWDDAFQPDLYEKTWEQKVWCGWMWCSSSKSNSRSWEELGSPHPICRSGAGCFQWLQPQIAHDEARFACSVLTDCWTTKLEPDSLHENRSHQKEYISFQVYYWLHNLHISPRGPVANRCSHDAQRQSVSAMQNPDVYIRRTAFWLHCMIFIYIYIFITLLCLFLRKPRAIAEPLIQIFGGAMQLSTSHSSNLISNSFNRVLHDPPHGVPAQLTKFQTTEAGIKA